METHYSILAWESPWTGESSGLYSPCKELDMTEQLTHTRVYLSY